MLSTHYYDTIREVFQGTVGEFAQHMTEYKAIYPEDAYKTTYKENGSITRKNNGKVIKQWTITRLRKSLQTTGRISNYVPPKVLDSEDTRLLKLAMRYPLNEKIKKVLVGRGLQVTDIVRIRNLNSPPTRKRWKKVNQTKGGGILYKKGQVWMLIYPHVIKIGYPEGDTFVATKQRKRIV